MSSGKRAHSLLHEVAHFGAGQFRSEGRTEIAALFGVAEDRLDVRTVGRDQPPRLILAEKPPALARLVDLVVEAAPGEIAAGQRRLRGPARRHRIERRKLRDRPLRAQPRGGDVAAENRDQRRLVTPVVERHRAVPLISPARRLHHHVGAGKRAHHVDGLDPLAEIAVRRIAEIGDVAGRHRDDGGIALEGMAGGADQREIALIGACEDQPSVAVLEHIDVVAVEQAADHDLAHLDGGDVRRRHAQHGLGDGRRPGPGRVDDRPCRDHLAKAAIFRHQPPLLAAFRPGAARAGTDHGAARRGIDGGQNHQAGIVHDAVGIFEGGAERPLQRVADRMVGDIEGGGRRQRDCARPAGRRAIAMSATARAGALPNGREWQSASGAPDAARSRARRRARRAPHGHEENAGAQASPDRHGSAAARPRKRPRRDRPAPAGSRAARVRRRRARC